MSKFGSVDPANAARGLGAVHSVITVLDPETGAPRATINGDSVTGLRTSAATTLAMQQPADRITDLGALLTVAEKQDLGSQADLA